MEKVSVLEVSSIRNQSVELFTGTKKYVATGDVDEQAIETFTEITYDNRPSRANIEVKLGQVLFARMKGTNKVIQIDESNQDYIYSTGFCVLEPSELVTTDYLRVFLKSDLFQIQKDKHSKGATQKAINNEGISKIKIPLPPLETQKKIVEALDKAQALVDARKEQIRLMDELVKSKFIEMFGDPLFNPQRQEITELDKLSSLVTYGLTVRPEYVNVGVHLISATEIKDGYINYSKAKKISVDDYTKLSDKAKAKRNDLLIGKAGASIGYLARVEEEFNIAITQNIARIELKNELVNILWLMEYLKLDFIQRWCQNESKGNAMIDFQIQAIKRIPIYNVDLKLQNKFADFAKMIEKSKLELQNSLNKLVATKKALMLQYFG